MWNKRRFLTDSSPIVGASVSSKELLQSDFYQASPVDSFMFADRIDNGVPSVCLTSDIYMLFNQQRLDKMTNEMLVQHFAEMSVTSSSMSDLRSKMTDDQLCSFVKSRFIQSPSELMAWSRYLMSSSDEVISQLAAESVDVTPAGVPSNNTDPVQTTE